MFCEVLVELALAVVAETYVETLNFVEESRVIDSGFISRLVVLQRRVRREYIYELVQISKYCKDSVQGNLRIHKQERGDLG